jgi:hypothetical protein
MKLIKIKNFIRCMYLHFILECIFKKTSKFKLIFEPFKCLNLYAINFELYQHHKSLILLRLMKLFLNYELMIFYVTLSTRFSSIPHSNIVQISTFYWRRKIAHSINRTASRCSLNTHSDSMD